MLRPSRLTAAVDRRLLRVVHTRARRRSPLLSLLPAHWLDPLLVPTAKRLRTKLMTGLLVLSVLLVATVFWVALQ